MRKWITLPNVFTMLRVFLTPVIVVYIMERRSRDALSLFAVAAATDAVDGYLARHFGEASASGAFLDPIADKLLMSGVYLALAWVGSVPWWLVFVIFGRDLAIVVAAAVALAATDIRAFPPSVWGKASTFLQIVTGVCFLGRDAFGSETIAGLCTILVWATLAMTVGSGVHYGWRGVQLLRMD